METIIFNGKQYPSRELEHPLFGDILISTISLNNDLINEHGKYVNKSAVNVDEMVFYFMEENEIILSENELTDQISKQVK